MMRLLTKLRKSEKGASLAEFALLFPLFAILTFGVLEVGYLMWQFQQGAIASKRAVRIAATRDLLVPGSIEDCGVATAQPAGTPCSQVPGSDSWSITCYGDGSGNAACGTDVTRVAEEIAAFYPLVTPNNIVIEISGAGLGFKGLGRPVPIITVRFVNVQFNFIVLRAFLGAGPVNMPALSASAPAEDLTNGPN